MQVTLSPELEAIAQQAAKNGGYDNIADFVAEAVRQSALKNSRKQEREVSESIRVYDLPYSDWKKRFDEFLTTRKATNPNLDDCRESMYLDHS